MDPDLTVFAKVVEAGSLSAAGRALSISPAMISKRLARLEARLGVRLLHRSTRKLALTSAGATFHADIVGILQALEDAERRLGGVATKPAGPLRVSAPTSFARLYIAPRLHGFLAAYPDVELDLQLGDETVDLLSGQVDVAVRITSAVPASLAAYRLCDCSRLLCASPAYLAEHGTPDTVAALARHRLLAASGQAPWHLVNGKARHVVEARSHVRTNSSEVVRELAISGVGIALRSLWDVSDALADGRLIPILPGWAGPGDLGIFAMHPRMPAIPSKITALVRFLQEELSPPPWQADAATPIVSASLLVGPRGNLASRRRY